MKVKLLLLAILFWSASCEKDDAKQYNLRGIEYPPGLTVVDLTSENDCSLSKCSERRITRLVANNVIAIVSDDSTLQISVSSDAGIKLRTCTKIDSAFLGDWDTGIPRVKLSGDIYDGCGILDYDYSIGEYYLIKIDAIEKF